MKRYYYLGLALLLALPACRSEKKLPVTYGEVIALQDGFHSIVPQGKGVERIGIDFQFTEGPAWHPGDYLVFSDIPANKIWHFTGQKHRVFREPSHNSNGLLFEEDGDLLACEHGTRRVARITPDGVETVIASAYRGRRLNSPNDLCQTGAGLIYFTDPPWGLSGRNEDPDKEIPFNGVYGVRGEEVFLVDSTLSWPNGIALSPAEDFLYVANFEPASGDGEMEVFWMRYPVLTDGSCGPGEVFYRCEDVDQPGGPDGMKVDSQGNLFVTAPGGVLVISSSGELMGQITLPIAATNLAFDKKEKTLFITARSTVYSLALD